MAFRSFRLAVIARCIFLSATVLLLVYLLTQTSLIASAFVLAMLLVYQVYALIHYVELTNREIGRFLLSIRYADFSQAFPAKGRGKAFEELSAAISDVVQQFQKIREEKEEHFLYLQTIVQHIGVGLIAFTPDGQVTLINTAAKRLLGIHHLIDVRSLGRLSDELVTTLFRLRSGERALSRIDLQGEALQLIINATELKVHGQLQTLVSVQNIQPELDEKEMEAWQKLVRVLTHEIMNSLTPISSLASTVNDMLKPGTGTERETAPVAAETVRDVRGAVETIEKRSKGLLHFVDAYRNLARIPRPNFSIIRLGALFHRVEQLMKEHLASNGIAYSSRVEPESLELTADPELIEQVLINLLRNAVDAVAGHSTAAISTTGRIGENGRVIVEVWDSGPGISKDMQERIFVPFFTTKPEGSGIGLSLSRQIMRLHNGSIRVNSESGNGTSFILRF